MPVYTLKDPKMEGIIKEIIVFFISLVKNVLCIICKYISDIFYFNFKVLLSYRMGQANYCTIFCKLNISTVEIKEMKKFIQHIMSQILILLIPQTVCPLQHYTFQTNKKQALSKWII